MQWSCSVDATSNNGMIIPESFDGSNRKPKKMNAAKKKKTPRKTKIALKYTVRTENHDHRKVALIPC